MHRGPPNEKAAAQGGAKGSGNRGDSSEERNTQFKFEPQGLRSWADVDHRTAQLTAVADYRDQLLVRIRWAQLKMELGMDVAEFDDLLADAQDFKQVCRALSAPSDERSAA
jgi:hypothetical protein